MRLKFMHRCSIALAWGLLMVAAASGQTGRAALPVDHVAPLPEHATFPLITIGRLPVDAKSPVDWSRLDDSYYASFRDNQLGRDAQADRNAADYALGKLKLLPPVEGSDWVIVIAVPDLQNTAVTVGSVVLESNVVRLSVDQWQPDETIARSKTTNARELRLLYLPPLPAGKYTLQVHWHVMSPVRFDEGSDYSRTEEKTAELPFRVRPSSERAADEQVAAASLPLAAMRSVEPIPKVPGSSKDQVPWLLTARRFINPGGMTEGIAAGSCDPFKFLRGDPAQPQAASALPKLSPPASARSTYVRIIGPPLNPGEWASLDGVQWNGNHVIINCALWTLPAERHANGGNRPMLLVELIPPSRRAGLVPITPPGKYDVEVRWDRLVAPRPGEWYVDQSAPSQSTEIEVK
jgi:hypothetical protein